MSQQYRMGTRGNNSAISSSPSLKYLSAPINPFNVVTPIYPAHNTEPYLHYTEIGGSPIEKDNFKVTNLSRTSLLVSSISPWKTSSDVGKF